MSFEKHRRDQIGVNTFEKVFLAEWGAPWQTIEAQNVDAIDGLNFWEEGGEMSNQIIFIQVKCMKANKRKDVRQGFPIS